MSMVIVAASGYTNSIMDHDRMFKELLNAFFVEFVTAFLPDVAAYLDPDSIEFMDKEVFTDVTAGEKHEVDILVKAKFRGQDTFFLVHVENQSSPKPDFPQRMFVYFARLHEKYGLPIYPVVIFSYDKPKRAEPTRYKVAFPGKTVLQFDYAVIQLNRIPWRRFLQQPNPAATALMTRMKMSAADRPRVRLQCMRLLATLKLDPAKSKLIGGFIEGYLQLSVAEMKKYEREFAALAPEERNSTMVMITSWEQRGIDKGLEQGRREGMEHIVLHLLRRQLGNLSHSQVQHIDALSTDQLDALSEALLDMKTPADLETWLAAQQG